MERFVRIIAPNGKLDFIFKLIVFLFICGILNHTRSIAKHGWADASPISVSFTDSTLVATPMVIFSLWLIQHLNVLQVRLRLEATTDQLTRLPNRRWFYDNCPPNLTPGHVLVLIDLDRFKSINDTYGHDMGDQCLVAMANHIQGLLPSAFSCVRLGGEEFVILFSKLESAKVEAIVAQVCNGIDVPIEDGNAIRVAASAGISVVEQEIAMRRAFHMVDRALYRAKKAGRQRYEFTIDEDLSVVPFNPRREASSRHMNR